MFTLEVGHSPSGVHPREKSDLHPKLCMKTACSDGEEADAGQGARTGVPSGGSEGAMPCSTGNHGKSQRRLQRTASGLGNEVGHSRTTRMFPRPRKWQRRPEHVTRKSARPSPSPARVGQTWLTCTHLGISGTQHEPSAKSDAIFGQEPQSRTLCTELVPAMRCHSRNATTAPQRRDPQPHVDTGRSRTAAQ